MDAYGTYRIVSYGSVPVQFDNWNCTLTVGLLEKMTRSLLYA
jgi:hypothetical protein